MSEPTEEDRNARLRDEFERIDEVIEALEARIATEESPGLAPILAETAGLTRDLMGAYAQHAGKTIPETDDLLAVFKAFVKGDPSLNAVRDNVRELVYYQNCLAMDREDALPIAPARMAVRTTRHIYLYLHSRSEQERRL